MPKSIAVVKGAGYIRHNNRDIIHSNVDPKRIQNNTYFIQEPIEVAYEKCFGEAIQKYDANQKRADRKYGTAKDYMNTIKNKTSKNAEKVFYENVVQVGNMFDSGIGSDDEYVVKQILTEYMDDFQKNNPNLYVFNAVLHMDEATPHLHIDYIPLAKGYKNGMEVRNSLEKALNAQLGGGKSNKKDNATTRWQDAEKGRLAGIMKQYGIDRAKDTGLKREHRSVARYKDIVQVVEQELKAIPEPNLERKALALSKGRVSVDEKALNNLLERAKLVTYNQENLSSLNEMLLEKTEGAMNVTKDLQKKQAKADKTLGILQKHEAQPMLYKQYWEKRKEKYNVLEKEHNSLIDKFNALVDDIQAKIEEAVAPWKQKVVEWQNRYKKLEESVDEKVEARLPERLKTEVDKATINYRNRINTQAVEIEDLKEEVEGLKDQIYELTPKVPTKGLSR
jgi:Chromosome segregation ATPases